MQSNKPKFGQKGPDPRELFKKSILGMRDPDSGKRVIPYKEQQKILKKK